MSLRLWLPLNGNLNNQGASNSTVTGSNVTTNTSGKIGSCYSFNGTSSFLLGTHNFLSNSTTDFSYCCWMKINSTQAGCLFSCRTATNSNGFAVFYYGSKWLFDDGARWEFTPTTTIATNTWYHVCFVKDSTKGSKFLYINGILDKSTTAVGTPTSVCTTNFSIGASQSAATSPSSNFLNGYLNDVRVYDHALSPKEVKEISKGSICHYPLDGSGKGGDNLLKTTPRSANTTAYNAYAINLVENLTIGKKYTIQFWDVNISHSGKTADQLKVNVFWGGGMNSECQINVPTGHADYLEITFTATANAKPSEAENAWLHIYNSVPNVSGTMSLTIGHWKLEEGEKATPWCPASTDTEYTTLGYNNNIEYDISGYKNNGTISGTLTSDNDTAKYNAATIFSSNSHISTTLNTTEYTDTYTFAWWGKFTNYSNTMMWGFANGNRLNLFMSGGNFYWNTGDSANNPFSGVSSTTYGDENWHHFAVSGDGTASKLYIDGVFKANSKTYKGITGTTLIFNGWDTGTSYNFNGSLSDFRLYATALSADDIKELYQSSAFIINNGSVMCYDFAEQ